MDIKPVDRCGSFRMGTLNGALTVTDINNVLGFEPNIDDDPSKVKYSWGFEADGVHCGIWDYKGVRWSTYGPKEIFEKLFGVCNIK